MPANKFTLMFVAFLGVQLLSVPSAKALEVLTAKELASHCALMVNETEGVDGQYCVRYIQGFIDGAIATDARVMLNAESAIAGEETFTERAIRTRMPNRIDRSRAAGLAGFCLGDPLPLREVVNVVVADLAAQQIKLDNRDKDEPAMEVVYKSLMKNYPCKE
jgi:hypothetical protein